MFSATVRASTSLRAIYPTFGKAGAAFLHSSTTLRAESKAYQELIRSIPAKERDRIIAKLNSAAVANRASLLQEELAASQTVGNNPEESRLVSLAALRSVRDKKISAAQLATVLILESAIQALCTEPMVHSQKTETAAMHQFASTNLSGFPTSLERYHFKDNFPLPKKGMTVADLPKRMQDPLMRRFFNFNDAEWAIFNEKMAKEPPSEQHYHVLVAPDQGCWSSIVFHIQKILQCMRMLDRWVASQGGIEVEQIMLVPSFSMFQAAIDAKAHTLGRKPVELVPTYGYIAFERYAKLKAQEQIATTISLASIGIGALRTTIDTFPLETPFAGLIHDIYHAMREMMMLPRIAKARIRMASIASGHPKNNFNPNSRPVHQILIDGELLFSYPPKKDTMFNPDLRPPRAHPFGYIFYLTTLKPALHPSLKRAFIKDMVKNKKLWQEEFGLGKTDLVTQDQAIYDEIEAELSTKRETSIPTPVAPGAGKKATRFNFFNFIWPDEDIVETNKSSQENRC